MERASLILTWNGADFRPRTPFDARLCERFGQALPLEAAIKERRTLPRPRLYWAVLQAVADATGRWATAEALHTALKIHLGYIEEVSMIDKRVHIQPRSTSFGKMSEHEFRIYFDAAMLVLTTEVLHLSVDEILALGRARLAGDAA